MKKLLRFFGFRKKRSVILRATGYHHDLKAIYDQINDDYFQGKLQLGITWTGNRWARPRTRIVLGSYHLHRRVIRINRILDHPQIPYYFVAYIVYHEMLHHVMPPRRVGRRREIHHRDFKAREKEFQEFKEAITFRKGFRNELFS